MATTAAMVLQVVLVLCCVRHHKMGVSKNVQKQRAIPSCFQHYIPQCLVVQPGSRRPHSPYSFCPSLSYHFKFKGTPTFHGMGGMAWVVAQTYPLKIAIHASRRWHRDHAILPNATPFDSYLEYVKRPPSKAPVLHHGNIQSCRHTRIYLGLINYKHTPKSTGARSTPLYNNQPGLYRN